MNQPTGYPPPPGQWPPPQAPVPPPAKATRAPWIVAVVAVLLAVAGVVWGLTRSSAAAAPPATGGISVAQQSFATPEEGVRRMAEQLAAGNTGGAAEVFAISSVAEKWDQVAYVDRVKAVGPNDPPNPKDPFFAESFTIWRLAQIGQQFRFLAFSLTLPEEMAGALDLRMMPLNDDLTAQAVVDGMTVGQLTGLTVERVEQVARTTEDRYRESMAPLLKAYGADEITELGVLYGYEGQTYLGGVTALRFGDSWQLWSLSSPMINTPSSGVLEPADAEDFAAAVGG